MSFHKSNSKTPLAPQQYSKIQPVISKFDPKNQNATKDTANFIYAKYKSEMNDIPVQSVAGSTLPLVQIPHDEESNSYNPFEHRKVEHPTSDCETLVHLLKGSLGSGILAMPLAFLNAGLWFGLIATFIIGAICTYCVHILVKCAHILSRRRQIPSLGFADVAETAFLDGPEALHKWSRFIRFTINSFLVIDLIGCCCIYVVFVSKNIKEIIDPILDINLDERLYTAMLLIPLILVNLIRNLKFLTPFSMIANIFIGVGMVITMYYILNKLPPSISERPAVASITTMPLFFGNVIFALEGIGVVMSLENNMKTPSHFIGCPSVLNIGMIVVVSLYASVGFLGYWAYGENTKASITLNLPNDVLAQCVKLMIALAIFFTYTLQFYVPMEIIWKNIKGNFNKHKDLAEYSLRISLVMLTVAIAAAIPNLGPFIALVGAVCLSTLGLIFPSLIEVVVYWERPGMGRFNWRLWKNCFLMLFGLVGFVTGSYVSILDIVSPGQAGGGH